MNYVIKTFLLFDSGGLNVTVSGMNLATVQTPQMYLYKDNWQSLHTVSY